MLVVFVVEMIDLVLTVLVFLMVMQPKTYVVSVMVLTLVLIVLE